MKASSGRPISRVILVVLLACAGCQLTPPPPPVLSPTSEDLLKKSVTYLASDQLEGRGLGTEGLELAANYIAGYFQGLGLKPAGENGSFFQTFTTTLVTGIAPETSLSSAPSTSAATAPAQSAHTYTQGTDFTPVTTSGEGAFDAGVVFVGYGISSPDYDDYAGVNVQGKVALAMRYEPRGPDGNSRLSGRSAWSEHAAIIRKAQVAAEHGAAALLLVDPPSSRSESLLKLGRRMGAAQIPVLHITRNVAADLFAQSRAPKLETYQTAIDSTFSPRSFILRRSTVRGNVSFARTTYTLRNVMGILPGKGPLAKQYIVVGGHYDHIGRGPFASMAPYSRAIHPGADDNASGTAAVMELARLFAQAPTRPARCLLFIAFTGEERGLLGSNHFVEHPTVRLNRIALMINLDMLGRIQGTTLFAGGQGTSAILPPLVRAADDASPLELKPVWENGIAPSDSIPFVMRRIPVLFFWSGMHPDYHRPSDTPDKINYPGEAQATDLIARLIGQISIQRKIPFAESHAISAATRPASNGAGATLGVVPDYSATEVHGLRITGTVPDSPAARAGLKPGDVLTRFASTRISNIYDLTGALNAATPGQPATLELLRDGKPISVQVVPEERP